MNTEKLREILTDLMLTVVSNVSRDRELSLNSIKAEVGEALVGDALAAIQELMPRWIPVSERLPEMEGFYPVVQRSRLPDRGLFIDNEMSWFGSGHFQGEVTHWMPIPAAPEGEELCE